MLKQIAISVAVCFLSGCAVTLPSSETIMFEKWGQKSPIDEGIFVENTTQQKIENSNNSIRRSVLNNFYSLFQQGFMTFSMRPELESELSYAKTKFASFVEDKMQEPDIKDEDFEIAGPLNFAIAFPFEINRTPTFAISGNIGLPVVGVDMTVQALKNTFFTTNLSYLSGEIIAQQRLYNARDIGLAIGAHYRLQRRWLRVIEGPDESFGISTMVSLITPARIYYNHTVGIRSVIYLPVSEDTFLHIVAAPGYVTNLDEFTINIGLSLKYQLW